MFSGSGFRSNVLTGIISKDIPDVAIGLPMPLAAGINLAMDDC
jgi:hypothetical protein